MSSSIPSPAPAGSDPALRARQEAAWEAYRAAVLRQQRQPSGENLDACARAHGAFERLFCGPTDPGATPLFHRTLRGGRRA